MLVTFSSDGVLSHQVTLPVDPIDCMNYRYLIGRKISSRIGRAMVSLLLENTTHT